MAAPFYIPTFPPAIREGSNFSTSSPAVVVVCLFDYTHPGGYQVVFHSFDLHFPKG